MLERTPPSADLALAYVHLSSAYALTLRPDAITWGEKAIALGEKIGCPEAVYSGLNNIGTIEIFQGDLAGLAKLERSRELAEQARDSFGVVRAYLHICWMLSIRREWSRADCYFDTAIAFSHDHGQELWVLRLRSLQMGSDQAHGRWDRAAETANSLLAPPERPSNLERCSALLVLGVLRARRGNGDPWPLLDEALELGSRPEVAHMLPSIAAARAEAAWLDGKLVDVLTEADRPAMSRRCSIRSAGLDLLCWRWRAGADVGDPPDLPERYRMLLTGDSSGARQRWLEHGSPYEAALAVVGSADVTALRAALEELRALGAWAAVSVVAKELRSLGERQLPVEPSLATRAHPAGLTRRETEVLTLLAAGKHNAEIAAELYVSSRTVDHHVSAILRKLNVRSRSEASAAAVRLGLVQT